VADPLDKPLYEAADTNDGMSGDSETSSAKYLKDHLEQIVVDTSETSSAPGRLKLHEKKPAPKQP
jgi:hypothetical protein